MIYYDSEGYLCDQGLDGGDSCLRASISTLFMPVDSVYRRLDHYALMGLGVRHPDQAPHDNPWNFTRDQMIPFLAALNKMEMWLVARDIFWTHLKRGFFAQNFQRDYPGSYKFPWPQVVTEDGKKYAFRWFDFADPMMPDHISHLILCAKIRWLYPFLLIGIPWLILISMYGHSKSSHKEHNQILSQCVVLGPWALKLFKQMIPTWREDIMDYWGSRNEIEYAMHICHHLDCI